ncbi:hypothetical protein MASR1M31_04500 [Porphyromonadaceae bacterium]
MRTEITNGEMDYLMGLIHNINQKVGCEIVLKPQMQQNGIHFILYRKVNEVLHPLCTTSPYEFVRFTLICMAKLHGVYYKEPILESYQ